MKPVVAAEGTRICSAGTGSCTFSAKWVIVAGREEVDVCSRHLAREAETMSWRKGERVTLGLVPVISEEQ